VRSMKTMSHHSQDEEPSAKISVQSLIDDAADLCHFRFQNHGIKLGKPSLDSSLVVDCRSHQIVQVLVNLMNNSFDAVEKLSEKWVSIEVQDRGLHIEIAIVDSGN